MTINNISATNFMTFEELNLNFSKGINVFFGENSTGKTAVLKLIYSVSKALSDFYLKKNKTKEELEHTVVSKLIGTYRCDNDAVGRLVGRRQGSNRSDIKIVIDSATTIAIGFSNQKVNHVDLKITREDGQPGIQNSMPIIFIPPKEIISSTSNFTSLYEDYHIDFEETYYDLAKLLLRPLSKGKNTQVQEELLDCIDEILNGKVIQKDNKFYLSAEGSGEFEMGLVSEGFRKLSTISYLIRSGSLNKNSILFWDEPESNMNPKMIPFLVEFLVKLSSIGVQIFVTTHSYFLQQEFNLYSVYKKATPNNVDIKFISLFRDENNPKNVLNETASDLNGISHNSIMEEFDDLYDRELRWSADE